MWNSGESSSMWAQDGSVWSWQSLGPYSNTLLWDPTSFQMVNNNYGFADNSISKQSVYLSCRNLQCSCWSPQDRVLRPNVWGLPAVLSGCPSDFCPHKQVASERGYPIISIMRGQLNSFLKKLFGRFVTITAIQAADMDISSLDYNNSSNQLPGNYRQSIFVPNNKKFNSLFQTQVCSLESWQDSS